jgi:hypothetical protein
MVPVTEGKSDHVGTLGGNQHTISPEEIAMSSGGSPSSLGAAKSSGIPIPGATVAKTPGDPGVASRPRPLRIGDKVRSMVDDVCVSVGLCGLVVNVAPPRYSAPARARVLWDNETTSMADASTFEVITGDSASEGTRSA